ncbi:MAG: response regulator [bacterium]|nr:response regulator [bacterium]
MSEPGLGDTASLDDVLVESTRPAKPNQPEKKDQILVVDDDDGIRQLLVSQIKAVGYPCRSAVNGEEALDLAIAEPRPSLVVSDVQMPGLSGIELLQQLKQLDPNLQVVMVSGHHDMAVVRQALRDGAYDYLIKPFELEELANTVDRALQHHQLLKQNEAYRLRLEKMVEAQTREILETRDLSLITLAKLAESRDNDTGLHLERMSEYSRRLAEEVARAGSYGDLLTEQFIHQLHRSSPLHDIGKVGIPDAILLKPAALTDAEFKVMQQHTTIGGDTLRTVIETHQGHTFLVMAMEIAYSHHERWDGNGYPNGLAESKIPIAARIVTLADAYDAITSQRPYKKAYEHEEAIRRITRDRGLHFDPVLVDAFLQCHEDFELIKNQINSSAPATRPGAPGAPLPSNE